MRKTKIATVIASVALAAVLVFTAAACGAATLTGITVTPPTKTEYFVGDTLDTAGMTVTANYDDESTAKVTDYKVSPTKLDKAGEQTITVTYGEKTATFKVTVTAVALTALAVSGTPSKLAYTAGEKFVSDGIAVKATYNNGDEDAAYKDYDVEYSLTGSDWSATAPTLAAGNTKVYVRVKSGDVTSAAAEYAVTVTQPVTGVTITSGDSATLYVGSADKGSITLEATVTPDNATDKTVTWKVMSGEGYVTLDGSTVTAKAAGTAVVRATAGDKYDEITITVAEKEISSIAVTEVEAGGAAREYIEYSATNVTATVTATYSDGSSSALESGYELDVSLTDGNYGDSVTFIEGGDATLYVQAAAGGKTAKGQTTVSVASLTGVTADRGNMSNSFAQGDVIDFSVITVTAAYDDEYTTAVTGYSIVAKPTEGEEQVFDDPTNVTLTEGEYSVYARYHGIDSAAMDVSIFNGYVVEAENIRDKWKNATGDGNGTVIESDENLPEEGESYLERITKPGVNSGGSVVDHLKPGAIFKEEEPASGGGYLGDIGAGAVFAFHVYSDVDRKADVILRASSGKITADEDDDWVPEAMGDMVFNKLFKVEFGQSVDGPLTEVQVDSSVILPGSSSETESSLLWVTWFDVNFGTVDLKAGDNVFKFTVLTYDDPGIHNTGGANIDRLEVKFVD